MSAARFTFHYPEQPERWRKITWVRGYTWYSVSDHGRVRNDKTGRIVKAFHRGYHNEYLGVNLCNGAGNLTRKAVLVHRLVAEAFLAPASDPSRREVNHFDGNPENNHYRNLEWCTRRENEAHKRFIDLTNEFLAEEERRSFDPPVDGEAEAEAGAEAVNA